MVVAQGHEGNRLENFSSQMGQSRVVSHFRNLRPLLFTFGEVVHAKRFERLVKEIELKIWAYNLN